MDPSDPTRQPLSQPFAFSFLTVQGEVVSSDTELDLILMKGPRPATSRGPDSESIVAAVLRAQANHHPLRINQEGRASSSSFTSGPRSTLATAKWTVSASTNARPGSSPTRATQLASMSGSVSMRWRVNAWSARSNRRPELSPCSVATACAASAAWVRTVLSSILILRLCREGCIGVRMVVAQLATMLTALWSKLIHVNALRTTSPLTSQ